MISHLPKEVDDSGNRHHFHETVWKKAALRLLARHAEPAGLSLLDYGCGRGETLGLAADLGIDVRGTDLDPECVEISSRHGETELLREPDHPIDQFGPKSFDVVTCFHVLEHVARPMDVLTDLGRIARRYVVVAVPNLRSLPRPRFLRHEPQAVNEGHLQGWDHAHFRNLAERHCGLRLVEWGFDHCKIPVVGSVLKALFGDQFLRRCETGPFVRWFPFHSASVIALLEPRERESKVERSESRKV